jgi:superfamily II DNA or RNA helicase
MTSITYLNPAVIILPRGGDDVKEFLSYRDKSVEFQIHRMKMDARYRHADWAIARIEELKGQVKKYACWEDEEGRTLSYAGLAKDLKGRFGWTIENNIEYPEPKALPWKKMPEFDLWEHQQKAFDNCLEYKHCGISSPTGSGKTRTFISIIKHFGLPTVIAVPSASIANQIHDELLERFGPKYVCMYGDGKKKSDKLITVGVAQALTRIEPGTDHWDNLSKKKVFIFDETHVVGADTFENVAMKVAANAPYRFFFSATHVRSDGTAMILKGITGDIAYSISFQDLVARGILAEPKFKMFAVNTDSFSSSSDAKKETRAHFYSNDNVNQLAADIANKCVLGSDRPTVILIEEFKQFKHLYPKLKVPFVFAHGTASKDNEDLAGIPKEHIEQDPQEAIRKFNSGEVKLLIGTSAVSTGVDLRPTKAIIMMQGGTSQVKVYQGIGRATRMVPGKKDFIVIDFYIKGSKVCERHAMIRKEMYEDLGYPVDLIGL